MSEHLKGQARWAGLHAAGSGRVHFVRSALNGNGDADSVESRLCNGGSHDAAPSQLLPPPPPNGGLQEVAM